MCQIAIFPLPLNKMGSPLKCNFLPPKKERHKLCAPYVCFTVLSSDCPSPYRGRGFFMLTHAAKKSCSGSFEIVEPHNLQKKPHVNHICAHVYVCHRCDPVPMTIALHLIALTRAGVREVCMQY